MHSTFDCHSDQLLVLLRQFAHYSLFFFRSGLIGTVESARISPATWRWTSRETDPAREPISASYSAPEAAHKTGRAKADFELSEISNQKYERLKSISI